MDVDVLVYAHREDAVDHPRYREWLEAVLSSDAAYGVSDVALSGFIRVVTHPRIFDPPSPLTKALGQVEATLLSEADRLRCRINGRGESTVSGELSLTRQGDYRMDLLVRPGPAVSVDVIDALKTFGQAQPGGAYRITDTGRI